MAAETVVRDVGESNAIWMLGRLYEIKASSDQTGGAMNRVYNVCGQDS